jgi:PAS domain S-box-containing protein/putative nucleotidyltransferase with HDIG domain
MTVPSAMRQTTDVLDVPRTRATGSPGFGAVGREQKADTAHPAAAISNAILAAEHDLSPAGILIVNQKHKIVSFNRRFAEMWEIPPDLPATGDDTHVLAAVLARVADPERFAARVDALSQCPAERSHDEILLKDGRIFDRHTGPMNLAEGTYIGRIWFFYDITELRNAERATREADEKFRCVAAHDLSGLVIIQHDHTIAYINPGFSRILGYAYDEVVGRPLLQILPERLKVWVKHSLEEQLAGRLERLRFETQVLTRDGVEIDLLIHAVLAQYKGRPASVAVLLDVTERNQAATELKRLNQTLRTVNAGNELLVRANSEAELLSGMCSVVVQVGGYLMAWIGFTEQDNDKSVRPVASAGLHAEYAKLVNVTWADRDDGRGIGGLAIRSGVAQVSQDIANDPRMKPWHGRANACGFAAAASFPLLNRGTVFGTFNIYAGTTDAFTESGLNLLNELAADLAFGIVAQRDRVARRDGVRRLRRAMQDTVEALANTVELRDPYTAGHQRRVAQLSAAIARSLGLPADDILGIYVAALVHDIGKVRVPAEILSKPGKLTKLERMMLQEHAQNGYEIIRHVDFPWPVAEMVLQHHERLDGSGYPKGLKAEAILPGAKILAVADVVEAITAHRPYREALGIEVAIREIERGKGTLFDAAAVDACIALMRCGAFNFDPHNLVR